MPVSGARVLEVAAQRAGLSYRLDPPPDGVNNVDCSLYVLLTLRDAGIPLPAGVRTAEQIRQVCTPVAWGAVQAGDLLFFEHTYTPSEAPGPDGRTASHVGISHGVGTGKMWDANDTKGVGVTTINPSPYWQAHIFEARRPPGLSAAVPPPVPAGAVPRGVDVASYQGRPDWAAVRAAGYLFGVTKFTEGLDYTNPTAAYNWQGMAGVGMKRGGYHWGRPALPARQQVEYFWQAVQQAGGWVDGDFLVLDMEEAAPGVDEAVWSEQFMDALDDRIPAEACVLYTGAWFTRQEGFDDNTALARYALWAAAYQASMPAPPAPWGKVTFWQYSSTGSVPGIVGPVDLNVYNGTAAELAAFGIPNVPAAPWALPNPDVGSGVAALMAADNTTPATHSTFLPLGRNPALIEECTGLNGVVYRYHLPTGHHWRYPAA